MPWQSFAFNTVLYFIAGMGCSVIGALVLNNPPFDKPPGFALRLLTYLTSNSAETRRDHRFPELELRCYPMMPAALFSRVEHAMEILGWHILDSDPQHYRLKAVIESAMFKFKDDLEVRLIITEMGTEMHIRSSSRVGYGDLGANTRHILNLQHILARQV